MRTIKNAEKRSVDYGALKVGDKIFVQSSSFNGHATPTSHEEVTIAKIIPASQQMHVIDSEGSLLLFDPADGDRILTRSEVARMTIDRQIMR